MSAERTIPNASPGSEPRVALIIGGTRGIGREMAVALRRRGYRVHIVGRRESVGQATASQIGATYWCADVSEMVQVQRLADRFLAEVDRLDLLVHCADVLRYARADSAEGVELCFAINYLSRVLLNRRLLPRLRADGGGRIVHVAAAGMPGALALDQVPPPAKQTSFSGHNTGQRANDVHIYELIERESHHGIKAFGFNPGIVDTEIRDGIVGMPWLLSVVMKIMMLFMRPVPAAECAASILSTVLESGAQSGLYDRKMRRISRPRREAMARQGGLWRASVELLRRVVPSEASEAAPASSR